ncbi:MAG: TonB-dependent receptor, partial [Opitutaceae bacterium]|nr:TonB-dependent receptor [Opitutaceae bacterium]
GSKSLRSNRHTANLFTRYSFKDGWLKGFMVGGGFNYRSGSIIYNELADGGVRPVYSSGSMLVNLMARYGFKAGKTQWSVSLNVNNALNHIEYRQTTLAQAGYGDPRSWGLTTSVTF